MKKFLVILLCFFALMGLLTTASISAQRNAWKTEAEKAWEDRDELEDEYDSYQQEAEELVASLTTERDAYALLSQAIEEENARLRQEVETLTFSLQEVTAELETQLDQANADKAWAEQRLQEALDILLTPVPSAVPEETPGPQDAPSSPVGLPVTGLDILPFSDALADFFIVDDSETEEEIIPEISPSPSPMPSCGPVMDDVAEDMAEETMEETAEEITEDAPGEAMDE